ncbi:cell wall-binding repeat-containing protein [Desulfosporosinus hippei]|uniref:cell wall-binding repeat-containing protein n=1 Tax=Desulfosporosinus hippei TaxID=569859 RepID=UPI000A7A0A46|nr:cell wall-binding repeat-containing protein [Desulfosporosinus hippei]
MVTVPNGHYDPDSGTVVFSTSHFSDYAVVYDPVIRLAGVDGVETALAIARAAYPGKVSTAVLATAGNYPDALAGSVLAHRLNAPILLVGDSEAAQKKVLDYLTAELETEGTVYILGSTAVIDQSFADRFRDAGIKQTIRLAGNDCYATSVKIAGQLQVETGTPVVLVSGEKYPDALSVSSIAAQRGYPILLVQKNGIPDVVKEKIEAIKPDKVYIIGLQGAVSEDVEKEAGLLSGLPAEDLIRIGGENCYDTSLAVVQYFLPSLSDNSGSGYPSKVQTVCIATGNNFPDALAGSVYAAQHKAPIILVDVNLPEQVILYLEAGGLSKTAIFGGEYVVGKGIEDQLRKLAGQ